MFKLLLLIIFVIKLSGSDIDTFLPTNSLRIIPDVHKANIEVSKGDIVPWYFDALIEQESCVRLRGNGYWAKKCWNPKSELLTFWDRDKKRMRENGIGFFQLTRVFYRNGTLRFDTIKNLKKKYPKQLKDLDWKTVRENPELQIKAGLLLWNDNYKIFKNKKDITYENKIWFSDSMYNGGYKYLNRERKECMLRKDCDQNIWFNNVEKMNKRGNIILYGKKTANIINREHVRNVRRRMLKYKKYYSDILYCIPNKNKIRFVTGKED